MTNEQWLAELLKIFPPEILGYKRPAAGIATDLDFSTYFPEFIAKDGVGNDKVNAVLRRSMSNDEALKLLINAIQNQLASCDLRLVTQALKGLMSAPDKIKLDGIQTGATNYAHPATHPATMITPDATHRFTTDAEKNTWNGKADASHGNHVPVTQVADNAIFLRNDDTWQAVTPGNIGAYTKGEVDSIDNTKAPLESPGLTGTPTAPTPATADVSTKLATTAFVLNLINTLKENGGLGGTAGESLQPNGWVKFSNGLILQWGSGSGANWSSFPIAFPTACFCAIASLATGGDSSRTVTSAAYTVTAICAWEHESDGGEWRNGDRVNYVAFGH